MSVPIWKMNGKTTNYHVKGIVWKLKWRAMAFGAYLSYFFHNHKDVRGSSLFRLCRSYCLMYMFLWASLKSWSIESLFERKCLTSLFILQLIMIIMPVSDVDLAFKGTGRREILGTKLFSLFLWRVDQLTLLVYCFLFHRRGIKSSIILFPLLGLTWVFGVLGFDQHTVVFLYLFAIFNSLQVCLLLRNSNE